MDILMTAFHWTSLVIKVLLLILLLPLIVLYIGLRSYAFRLALRRSMKEFGIGRKQARALSDVMRIRNLIFKN